MSQAPPTSSSGIPATPQPGKAMAITAFVLALLGLILPPLALVGLILGIVALARGTAAKGLAIASVAIAPVAMVMCLGAGILLPALGKARQAAQQMKSSTQLRVIGQGLIVYAQNNRDAFPEPGADWEQRLISAGLIVPELLDAPPAEPGQRSYFYMPGNKNTFDSDVVLMYENPDLWRGRGGHVLYADTMVQWIHGQEYQELFEQLERERRKREQGR